MPVMNKGESNSTLANCDTVVIDPVIFNSLPNMLWASLL